MFGVAGGPDTDNISFAVAVDVEVCCGCTFLVFCQSTKLSIGVDGILLEKVPRSERVSSSGANKVCGLGTQVSPM